MVGMRRHVGTIRRDEFHRLPVGEEQWRRTVAEHVETGVVGLRVRPGLLWARHRREMTVDDRITDFERHETVAAIDAGDEFRAGFGILIAIRGGKMMQIPIAAVSNDEEGNGVLPNR